MADVLRRTHPLAAVIRDTRNLLKKQIGAGAAFHLDASEVTITAANATDLPTALTLVNQLAAVFYGVPGVGAAYPGHINDDLAHKAVDGTNTRSSAYPAVDLATAITLANELKADYNAHIASAVFNYNADATNATAAANATDLPTLQTLLNELKGDLNAHMASAPANCAPSIRLVSA